MKDLIERLRCGIRDPQTLTDAADALEQQAAVIEQMRSALELLREAEWGYACDIVGRRICADHALTLQPCPEVLAKVKADAHRAGMLAAAEICEQRTDGMSFDVCAVADGCTDAIREAAKS